MSKKKAKKKLNAPLTVIGTLAAVIFVLTIILFYYNRTEKVVHYPDPSDYFFVEDYSGVLNEDTESRIYKEAVSLYDKTGAQVVVVTVPETQGESLEDFSYHLANDWGIGDEKLDNGVTCDSGEDCL